MTPQNRPTEAGNSPDDNTIHAAGVLDGRTIREAVAGYTAAADLSNYYRRGPEDDWTRPGRANKFSFNR